MKKIFISAEYNQHFAISNSSKTLFKLIPEKIGLLATIQFSNLLGEIKKELENIGKKVFVKNKGLVLGCQVSNVTSLEREVQAFFYIGSGKFHPLQIALALKERKQIFLFNPMTQEFSELDWNKIDRIKARQKAQKIKVLSSDKIGILVSTKSGQLNLDRALELKEKFEKKSKKAYIFLFETLDSNQFENWPDLAWVNTACPGLSLEQPLARIDAFS